MSGSFLYIFSKEFKSYFLSPIAYIIIAIFLGITGFLFFSPFFLIGRADLRSFFSMLPIIFSFAIPAITMRSYSEELRSGSYEILITLPVTLLDVLLGKFLAVLSLVAIMILPTLSYPMFISLLGDLDWGPIMGGYLGALLLAASYCAIGLLASSLTRNQIVAFIVGLLFCFSLTMIDNMLIFFPRPLFFQGWVIIVYYLIRLI